jgi:colanic acid biosynthesis glycosyl transferase WcaI
MSTPASPRSRTSIRASLGLPTDRVICVLAHDVNPPGQSSFLVLCAQLALESAPELYFVFVGSHEGERKKRRIEKLGNVRFLDPQTESGIRDVLAAADILLVYQPADVDPMTVPPELDLIIAARCPIVAAVSAEGEIARIVTEASAGIVVNPIRPFDLITSIGALAKSVATPPVPIRPGNDDNHKPVVSSNAS